jgi:alpha-L-fucosidase 2
MRSCFQQETNEYFKTRGEKTSNTSGWLVYTSHNPFGAGGWQMNLPASAWYALHFSEHATFAPPSKKRWDEALPILTELSHFWLNRLKKLGPNGAGFQTNGRLIDTTKIPELAALPNGTLVIPNGWSPEHGPRHEDGVAHDQQIITELFLATLMAANEVNAFDPLYNHIETALKNLAQPQIGAKGNLMEWLIDRDPETDHRHTSHLFALYPGTTISPRTTPELATAAERSLRLRKTTGDSRRSWAWAWRAALWARLKRGDESRAMLQGLLQHNILDNGFASHKIPLQIDGNYGIAAAILEQLIHTRPGEIELLPALPQAWPEGSLKGARAHNGLVIDLAWKDHQLTDWKIDAPTPTPIKVHANGQTYNLITPCSAPYDFLSGQTR